MADKLLNLAEAAAQLGIAYHTCFAWVRSGKLPAINLTPEMKMAAWRIRPDDLRDFIDAHEHRSQPRPIARQRKRRAVEPPKYV